MTDYISRDKVYSGVLDLPCKTDEDCYVWVLRRDVAHMIDGIHVADVRPVVRGKWLKSPECPEEYDICSVCGLNDKHRTRGNAEHPAFESIPPFCKWCGADMRKEAGTDGTCFTGT